MIRRRISLIYGAAALALPWTARAQRPQLPVVGYLSGVLRADSEDRIAAFRKGLAQAGYTEGRNVIIEYRFADGDYSKLQELAAELVRLPANLIVSVGGPRAAQAAKATTSTVPIVFILGNDPVKLGIVQSMNRPGGNATGINFLTLDLVPKRFELMRELLPKSKLIALMINPNTPSAEEQITGAKAAARATGTQWMVVRAANAAEIDSAFKTLAKAKPDALVIGTDAMFGTRYKQFVASTAQLSLPAIYEQRNAVLGGGLMSYGPSINEAYAQLGVYTGRVLGGTKPQDLPVIQPTRFELAINGRTAKTLGIVIPQSVRLRADEIIE